MSALRFLAWLGFVLAFSGCRADRHADALTEASTRTASTAEQSASVVASATVSSVAPPPPVATVTATPVLFEVKKGTAVGYLFGTMHTGVDAEKELNPVVFAKLAQAETIVLEADVFNVDPMQIAKMAMVPAGSEGVSKKLKPGHWQIVVDRLSSFMMPESSLAQMKAWFIGTMLVQKILPEVEPIDSVVYNRAKKSGKKFVFLETVKEQLEMVEKTFDVSVLDDMLADMPKTEKMTLELAAAYRKGDIEALTALTFDADEMRKHPPMFELLFFTRNRNWVPKLSSLFDQGRVFVAVGAGHLLGDKGVGALLRMRGFSVERITL